MTKLVYLVPLFPFIGFLLNGLFRKKLSKALTSIIGSGVILASFVVSLMIFFEVREEGFKPAVVSLFDFINISSIHMKTMIALRRVRTPMIPIQNKAIDKKM